MNLHATNLTLDYPSPPSSPFAGAAAAAIGGLPRQFAYPSPPTSPRGGGLHTRRRSGARGGRDEDAALNPQEGRMAGAPPENGVVGDVLIISGLIAVQLINSVYMVMLTPVLALGLKPLFLVTFGSLANSAFLFPFAFAFEKKKWPSRLSPKLMVQFFLIALGGVALFQALMLLGIKKTSPAIAAAMPNLAPGIIFVIAACLRFEKVDFNCLFSRAKILGTFICLSGAIAMSFLQSPSTPPVQTFQTSPFSGKHFLGNIYEDWFVGCSCLLAGVFLVSCTVVLQAATMIHFPAPFSLCVATSLIGALLTAIMQIAIEGNLSMGSTTLSLASVVAIVLLGAVVSAFCVAFTTWAVKRKGPVLVSMFSPIQTVCSAVLSAIILGQVIKWGSLGGMFVMFSGLYMVLWAKKKENLIDPNADDISAPATQLDEDIEKPLLT